MKGVTVWAAVYDVFRAYNITTIFGNPGSTEQPMLKNFPSDFRYVLGLQEASVVGMADGFAQATRNPAVAVLHTAAGTGNGMGNIISAFLNKSPLIIIAGQQTRQMLLGDPYLTNREATKLPEPWVKWSYQPARAEDVPAALVRAIAMASMPPAGPVFLSIPLDDWATETDAVPTPRTVSTRTAPDPDQLSSYAAQILSAKKLALVLGEEVDKSLGWAAAVKLAELLKVPVFVAPLSERAVFPEDHPLFRGSLPIARGALSTALEAYDLALVVGAEVWRYYPWDGGPVSPPGLKILQVTNDPHDAGSALVGDSMLSDARLALERLYEVLHMSVPPVSPIKTSKATSPEATPARSILKNHTALMTASEAFSAVALLRREGDLLVQESASNVGDLLNAWPIVQQESYFTSASGGLGWGGPAAVGIALAQRNRTVILAIGDGSLHYSVQSIYTAVQQKAKLIILVPRNEEYAILKEFAVFEDTPNCPALNLPGLNAVAIAEAYGCPAFRADTPADLYEAFQKARTVDGPVLIEFQIDPKLEPLPI